jgi:hypothetical protein
MAQWRKRPKQCQHPYCQCGECGKCAYNPRSNYPMFHYGDVPARAPGCVFCLMLIVVVVLFLKALL